ncbi:MAG: ferrochelatase [Chloroflexi bacterium]|nr:ferrochelatase [Chloroflexota bacterium]
MNNSEIPAVLLMAYGGPDSLADVAAYYTDVRGGRPPSPELLAQLTERYRAIGGRSPLLQITSEQAGALEATLQRAGYAVRVYVGMKHWHPFIAEAISEIVAVGHRQAIALVLAPHYSRMSVEGYFQCIRAALEARSEALQVSYITSYHDHPLYVEAIAEKMEAARAAWKPLPPWEEIHATFTAHSLPARILEQQDPYPDQLQTTGRLVAARLNLPHWRFAFQSAGRATEPWLGPDLLATLDAVAAEGGKKVLVAPIGFVSDHLEVLYDIDIEAQAHARTLGLELRRTASQNAGSAFIACLAALVESTLDAQPLKGR